MIPRSVYVGQAGWSLNAQVKDVFPQSGTHLERYSAELNAVEINSSFYRPHQQKTYAKWAASVPPEFRFAVKIPKVVTHDKRLADCSAEMARFLDETSGLGVKLGPLLVQLPPSLSFEAEVAQPFFAKLRQQVPGPIVCEARHATWFHAPAQKALAELAVAQVVADPIACGSLDPLSQSLLYLRLHGSPQMYYSAYSEPALASYAELLLNAAGQGKDVWCVFDNTAAGAAIPNALFMQGLLRLDQDGLASLDRGLLTNPGQIHPSLRPERMA